MIRLIGMKIEKCWNGWNKDLIKYRIPLNSKSPLQLWAYVRISHLTAV